MNRVGGAELHAAVAGGGVACIRTRGNQQIHDELHVLQGWTSGSVMSFLFLVVSVQSAMSVSQE